MKTDSCHCSHDFSTHKSKQSYSPPPPPMVNLADMKIISENYKKELKPYRVFLQLTKSQRAFLHLGIILTRVFSEGGRGFKLQASCKKKKRMALNI